MTCLDPLGYTASQYFIVPFLVLKKAFENHVANPTDNTAFCLRLVKETCANMIMSNDALKK